MDDILKGVLREYFCNDLIEIVISYTYYPIIEYSPPINWDPFSYFDIVRPYYDSKIVPDLIDTIWW